MKKITLFLTVLIFVTMSWQSNAQVVNDNATWPNVAWSLSGTYDAVAGSLSDPTTTANFSFDDDAAGNGSDNTVNAESPVIDLTAAFTAGETLLTTSFDYALNVCCNQTFKIQYFDADAATWVDWEELVDNGTAADYQACTLSPFTSMDLDFSGFTATQQSGFKYRLAYDDAAAWAWGFCMASPTIVSAVPPVCVDPSAMMGNNLGETSVDLVWTVGGAEDMWEIVYGVAPFTVPVDPTTDPSYMHIGPGATPDAMLTGLTASNDYNLFYRAHCGGTEYSNWIQFDFTTLSPPPANDDFANAEMLTVNATCTNTLGTNAGATASGETPFASCGSTDGTEGDVWYTFVAPADGNVTVTTSVGTGANLDTVMAMYSYDGTALTQIDCSDDGAGIAPFSEIAITDGSLVDGDTYYVRIHEYNGDNSDDFNICAVSAAPVGVANDECVGAIAITVNAAGTGCGTPVMIDNTGATDSSATNGTPSVCANNGWLGGADVWYTFDAPASGSILIMTPTPSAWSSMVYAIYDDCGSMTEVFCGANYDITANGGATSQVDGLTAGNTYYMRIWDYNQNEEGEVAVCIEETSPILPPVNDNVCDAIELTVDAVSAGDAYTSIGATTEVGEPEGTCFDGGIEQTIWFTFVAPAGGMVTVTTDIVGGTFTDTEIAIYEAPADCADAATMGAEVGCDQDGGVDVNFNSVAVLTGLTEGNTYYVQVDRWGGTAEGTFGIEVQNDGNASIEDLQAVGFNYYPNPVSNDLNLRANENITNVSIFNMLGQEVKSIAPSSLETTINMSNLANGTYFVKAQVGDAVGTFKIVKK